MNINLFLPKGTRVVWLLLEEYIILPILQLLKLKNHIADFLFRLGSFFSLFHGKCIRTQGSFRVERRWGGKIKF